MIELVPLFALSALIFFGLPLFAVHVSRAGLPRDPRIAQRKTGPFLSRFLMYYLMWLIGPLERLLGRAGVSPNLLTFGSLLLSGAAATALGLGHFGVGGGLYLITGLCDIIDGRVARATGRVTKAGAFYDSVIDRWAEALVFCGLAYYYRNSWVLALALVGLIGSFMVSYARARGEALGVDDADVGVMQRPERIVYLGVGLALAPLGQWSSILNGLNGLNVSNVSKSAPSLHLIAVLALGLVAVASLITAVRRTQLIFRKLSAESTPRLSPVPKLDVVAVESKKLPPASSVSENANVLV